MRLSSQRLGGALVLALLAACGRIGFTDAGADATDDGDAQPDNLVSITAAGVWDSDASELSRTLATSASRTTFTLATWYRTSDLGAMLMCAGAGLDQQSFIWSDVDAGLPYFEHQVVAEVYAAAPRYPATWPHLGRWVHLVLQVDLTLATGPLRVRWWIDGEEQMIDRDGTSVFPLDAPMYLGDTLLHTIGNKYNGQYPWTGRLADTYLIWGHALDASAFIRVISPGVVRSIVYAGPVENESVHFDYSDPANPGHNAFAGQPDWTATAMTTATTDLPY